jgi:AdoMet-dependent rRNA methyltransferase SPB1
MIFNLFYVQLFTKKPQKYYCSKYTIIGVDLDTIKKVTRTHSFIGDISTQNCYSTLKKIIKRSKCDVLLNDGVRNAGADCSKDAYTQSKLVLIPLKLACNFLKDGGYFITKVFRSTDFQCLMWVFKKPFARVKAKKPKASRFV